MSGPISFLTTVDDVVPAGAASTIDLRLVEFVTADGHRVATTPSFRDLTLRMLTALSEGREVQVSIGEDLTTADEAAQLLGVTRPTIYAWQDRGLLAREDQGNRRMVPMADVHRYLREKAARRVMAADLSRDAANGDADAAAAAFAGNLDLTRDSESPRPRRPRRTPTAAR